MNKLEELPLHAASREGNVDIVRFYINRLSQEVDIDTPMCDGWTAFFFAAVNGYVLTVEALKIQGHCNVNALDKFKRTALHWVARYNNYTMTKKLLELGVNHKKADMESHTAFDLARLHHNLKIAELINKWHNQSL